MWRADIIFERVPIVWILVGLLFQASGLYLGFDYALSFLYMIIGAFCFAFGVAILVFRMRERPKAPEKTRLSPQFISAGATTTSMRFLKRPAPAPGTTKRPAGLSAHHWRLMMT